MNEKERMKKDRIRNRKEGEQEKVRASLTEAPTGLPHFERAGQGRAGQKGGVASDLGVCRVDPLFQANNQKRGIVEGQGGGK